MPRYKLTVAYDGTHFHGWQKQVTGADAPAEEDPPFEDDPLERGFHPESWAATAAAPSAVAALPVRTAQGVLEEAVRLVVREPVAVTGASRTDSGVHARGQVAAFSTTRDIPVKRLPRAITSRLPDDIQVLRAEPVDESFDPIRGAIAKGYRYQLAHGCARRPRPLFNRHMVAHTAHRLDPALMNEAARRLMGEHDFASFARIAHGRESTVRTIYDCKVTAVSPRRVQIDVAGNGFLYNMVRIIAGTLAEVGRGRIDPASIGEIIQSRDRRRAGPTMPPEGLCLMWIRYPD